MWNLSEKGSLALLCIPKLILPCSHHSSPKNKRHMAKIPSKQLLILVLFPSAIAQHMRDVE